MHALCKAHTDVLLWNVALHAKISSNVKYKSSDEKHTTDLRKLSKVTTVEENRLHCGSDEIWQTARTEGTF